VDWGSSFGRSLLSSSCASPLPLPRLSLSCGSPKGCIGVRSTPPLHPVVLREFQIWSKPTYFHYLGWIRKTRRIHCSPYVYETTRCYSCDTKSLRRCCRTGVVTSSSTRPRGQLCWLHHQRLCRGVIHAFDL
jgi:hypothetical protein